MSTFTRMFERLVGHEGGYVNHPNDPGGETNWGVTKRVAQAHGYHGDMRKLSKTQAQEIAEKSYYKAIRADELDEAIGWQLFDAAYNHGNRNAVKFLQRAVGVNDDGIIGPVTLGAVKAMDKNDVILKFNAERLDFYTRLGTWLTFGRGWARRISGNLRYAARDN